MKNFIHRTIPNSHGSGGYRSIEVGLEEPDRNELTLLSDLVDHYNPPYTSTKRRSTTLSATFNIISTLLDGTVLSLPFAFAKCGVWMGIILLVSVALLTYSSLIVITTLVRTSKLIVIQEFKNRIKSI